MKHVIEVVEILESQCGVYAGDMPFLHGLENAHYHILSWVIIREEEERRKGEENNDLKRMMGM